jgi:hypothetical protein
VTESRDSYSPERRTALLFTGTGADGAYHAGAMRALQEAGVKIDIVGGRGRRTSPTSIAGDGRFARCAISPSV